MSRNDPGGSRTRDLRIKSRAEPTKSDNELDDSHSAEDAAGASVSPASPVESSTNPTTSAVPDPVTAAATMTPRQLYHYEKARRVDANAPALAAAKLALERQRALDAERARGGRPRKNRGILVGKAAELAQGRRA